MDVVSAELCAKVGRRATTSTNVRSIGFGFIINETESSLKLNNFVMRPATVEAETAGFGASSRRRQQQYKEECNLNLSGR